MKTHNVIQGSDEWHEVRRGKMTASNAQAISANGKGLESYIYDLLAEKFSKVNEKYTNPDLERGKELEPVARDLYELETGNRVEQVGFIEYDEYTGCSPDGLVGKDGGVEIKCLNNKNHLYVSVTKKIDPAHEWQMQMNMLITGRKWWDYICFNPNFKKDLVIIRVEADEEKQKKIKEGLEKGKKLIQDISKNYE